MTRDEAEAFAADWADAWNRRAVEAVLEHLHDEVVFTSPRAQAVVGAATVRGKAALRDYWNKALSQVESLVFVVDRIVWDPDRLELAIIYTAEINGQTKRVSEN